MKREFHAHYAFALQDSATQAYALDWLVDKSMRLPHGWREISIIKDDFARLEILAQAIVTGYKEQARMGSRKNPTGLYYWIKRQSEDFLIARNNFMRKILASTLPDLSLFPAGSWAIQVHFTLRKPYLSKDDVDFYIIDNPVKKEWVFKVPYVAPSQWKGALRAAMVRQLVENLCSKKVDEEGFTHERLRLYRLFGNEKDGTAEFLNRALTLHRVGPRPADEQQAQKWEKQYKQVARAFEEKVEAEGYRKENIEGFRGRLHFYPTFFDYIGLEVINPHPRDTGAGKQPIYFECVPVGTPGVFTLLYVPLDRVGKVSQDEIEAEAQKDLKAVARGVCAMLTRYGFGAKTSSGYGVADVLKDQSQVVPPDSEEIFWKAWEKNNV